MIGASLFRDQPQVERIRERLWSGREFGRAAVMVGAGFSRNAERSSPDVPVFPLWGNLAEAMYDALYPPGSIGEAARQDEKNRITSGLGAMRLASEYETLFGRSALDDFLVQCIPDERYVPARLHQMLLSLPWADVFTTNYDTLLERTRSAIHERKYDLVLTASDLPSETKPRIVKLHGSFPSHRPFIITEEDYRTYPTRSGSFVNLVQQSVMENVFCLLGFSGDDPNFLNWIGWVRDNLGTSAPPIYLCGLLDLSNAQRRLLEHKNVTPIDLSPLFANTGWHDPAQRHAKAVEWFLLNLMEGEPPKVDGWPIPSTVRVWEPSDGVPYVPEGPRPMPDPGPRSPVMQQTVTSEDIDHLLGSWRETRMAYPGWVIAPERNRSRLWDHTEYWVEPALRFASELPATEGLFLLRELSWRLQKCLVPLFSPWAAKIVPVLETYNPFPNLIELSEATVKSDQDEHRDLDWNRVAECWVELSLALARQAREEQDNKGFRFWMSRVESVIGRDDTWRAHWFHEECMFHLFRLDQERVRSTLEDWPAATSLPFWEVKRAAVLAELGQLEDAERVTSEALATIRSRMRPYSADYTLLSQEGLALFLLEGIQLNSRGTRENVLSRHRDRRATLERYGCDPWAEIENLKGTVVGRPPPLRQLRQETVPAFDPGRETKNTNLPSGFEIGPILPAFALLRMIEEGPLPPRIGNVNLFPETLLTAARWAEPHEPAWSFTAMLRQAKEKEVNVRWDRAYVATLSRETVDHLFGLLQNSLTQSIRHLVNYSGEITLQNRSFSQQQIKVCSKLLSKLAFRCSIRQRQELFDLAKHMYGLPFFRGYYWFHECVSELFIRLLSFGASREEILRWVPELLSLLIPAEAGFEVSVPDWWAEPFDHIRWDYDTQLDPNFDRSSWDVSIENLLRIVRTGKFDARARAASRLAWLLDIGTLNDDESRAFGEALWSRLDDRTNLPTDTRYFPQAFLALPSPDPERAENAFREYVRSLQLVRTVQRSETSDGSRRASISYGPSQGGLPAFLLGSTARVSADHDQGHNSIDWSSDEVVEFLQKIVGLWDEEKDVLAPYIAAGSGELLSDLTQLMEERLKVVAEVLLPRMQDVDEENKAAARTFINEVEQVAGVSVSEALPALLYINPNFVTDTADRLMADMTSDDEQRVRSAARGVLLWVRHAGRGRICPPPDNLLDRLINRSLSRKQAALTTVLACLRDMLGDYPEVLDNRQLDALAVSLENLLEDTELPEYGNRDREEHRQAIIPVEWRPQYRWMSAQLAYQLFRAYRQRDVPVPQVLERWGQICQQDTLPEVREAWG